MNGEAENADQAEERCEGLAEMHFAQNANLLYEGVDEQQGDGGAAQLDQHLESRCEGWKENAHDGGGQKNTEDKQVAAHDRHKQWRLSEAFDPFAKPVDHLSKLLFEKIGAITLTLYCILQRLHRRCQGFPPCAPAAACACVIRRNRVQ